MGALVRRYWIPVLRADELAPGGRVKRVQLLGERLVAYRTPRGMPGLIGEYCPHRGASFYFGRVEDDGMRCVYHGWKFGLDGRCHETPNEPPESNFAAKLSHSAYPCVERGGLVWTYMGPGEAPALPALEWMNLPGAHVFASKRVQECNWFQGLEGGIDSSHISFLHAPLQHSNSRVTRDMDQAIQESQGAIVDRSQERLGSADTAIIQVRKRLLSAARALQEPGALAPPGLDPTPYVLRTASAVLAPDADWVEAMKPMIYVPAGDTRRVA